MSTITLPAQFAPKSFILKQNTSQRVSASPFGGSEQAVDLLNDRWICSVELVQNNYENSSYIEAFIAAMRGQVNNVALYHFARPQPRGTMRGSLTISASAAQGASSIVVTGGAGQALTTILRGDMLGVGGLLLMAASDCTANSSGVITIPIVNRLRKALSPSDVVTWDKPTALFRILSANGVEYVAGMTSSVSIDFGEVI